MSGAFGGLEVFAVEDHGVQLTWSHLPPGDLDVAAGDVTRSVEHPGGPGALDLDGLKAGCDYEISVTGAALPARQVLTATTLRPPGAERYRLATVSDLHVGIEFFGVLRTLRDDGRFGDGVGHPVACTAAALDELTAWGAQRLVVKGDVTEHGRDAEWEATGQLLSRVDVPVTLLPGNHDVDFRGGAVEPIGGAARAGLDLVRSSTAIDVDGARIVLFDSTGAAMHQARVEPDRRDAALELLGGAGGGCLLLTHHHFQRTSLPWFWPPGIPPRRGEPFLRAVQEANPNTLVSSGHTHRHRRRRLGTLDVTEVGSPKDYPGTWAGYVVYDGGIRQVVRRVGEPAAIGWTEHTGRAALTTWRRWSPGRLEDRCFVQEWN